jgi:IS5 family transposase
MRPTRKAEFLARMGGLVPWAEFRALIEPHYPKAGNGRLPLPFAATCSALP